MVNNNDNDLYIYFEVINQIEPCCCVDFGPFLKLSGCIARQAKDIAMVEGVKLIGVDLIPEVKTAVHGTVYDEITDLDTLCNSGNSVELAILVGVRELLSQKELRKLTGWVKNNCKYFCTDFAPEQLEISKAEVKLLQVNNQKYYIYLDMEN